ncbi:MAG TPA: c-type cytochrome [Vicinamibacteria bacterium]|nr:c-type cytochrome [Vicinamibacteria bacterium]
MLKKTVSGMPLLGAAAVFMAATACGTLPSPEGVAQANVTDIASIDRGKYLVTTMMCNDCHTPWVMTENGPGPDMTRMLSGHPEDLPMPPPPNLGEGPWVWMAGATNTAFAGPWGISYAFNLTPDVNTGLGIWTEDMFVRALRTGRHMGVSRPIQPPMPWPFISKLTDEDLKAIYAYLRTIPPIHNRVPDYMEPHEVEKMKKDAAGSVQ